MKKICPILILLLLCACALSACNSTEGAAEAPVAETFELALLADLNSVDDASFIRGAWNGVRSYGEEFGVKYTNYEVEELTDSAYMDAYATAVAGGAKIIVCPGETFSASLYEAQTLYPDVCFIQLDGQPTAANSDEPDVAANVYCIYYAEEQAGFLAGYAAVREGYSALGFIGGQALDPVVRYGYGFAQGVSFAAQEMEREVTLKYHYTGSFDETPEAQSLAASWYEAGTEVIFACGGEMGLSVMAAAEEKKAAVIGVDIDQSEESKTVVTSALKDLQNTVFDGIARYYEGDFPGGEVVRLDASQGGVALPKDFSQMKSFDKDAYDKIFEQLALKKIEVLDHTAAETVAGLSLPMVVLDLVE